MWSIIGCRTVTRIGAGTCRRYRGHSSGLAADGLYLEVDPTFLARPLCGVGDHELELAACRAG
jgi:hypothetical protein